MTSLTREQVREIDRRAVEEYGMSSLILMENAGRGVADLLLPHCGAGTVCICCGKGNNGGDGFVVARHLEAAGVPVHVLLLGNPDELTGDAAVNFRILEHSKTPMSLLAREREAAVVKCLKEATWTVDALLGTGLRGEVLEPYAGLIDLMNQHARRILSVDLPSGLDCDTGRPLGACVRAECTATFVALKSGFGDAAAKWTGAVTVLSIGVPRQLLEFYNC